MLLSCNWLPWCSHFSLRWTGEREEQLLQDGKLSFHTGPEPGLGRHGPKQPVGLVEFCLFTGRALEDQPREAVEAWTAALWLPGVSLQVLLIWKSSSRV